METANDTFDPSSSDPTKGEGFITLYCKFCNKPFTAKTSGSGRRKMFCSNACRYKYHNLEKKKKAKDSGNDAEHKRGSSNSSQSSDQAQDADNASTKQAKDTTASVGPGQATSEAMCPEQEEPAKNETPIPVEPEKVITTIDLEKYRDNPFVSRVTLDKITLRDSFYVAAKPFVDLGVDKLFSIFELNILNFDADEKNYILKKVRDCPEITLISEAPPFPCTDTALRIMFNRMAMMDLELEQLCKDIGEHLHDMTTLERKNLCLTIKNFPKDPAKRYTTSHFLKLMNISRNSYYCYIGNERYGLDLKSKDDLDEPIVRQAFEYKGFKKGVRSVYMLIPRLSNKKIGIDRVRRIMKENGMVSGVRAANPHKRAAAKHLKDQIKPNILRRMFKLHRPNKVRVTDVTYLDIKNGIRAYGSALIDPVTNVLVVYNVSENNDMDLVLETLCKSDSHPCVIGGYLHSDQGVLYLSDTFQEELKKMGLDQSMSKRGNCQDNAVAESFFSVFKTEVNYKECESIEELKSLMEDFRYYYNYERGHWNHEGMTPIEYESYLLSMSDAEFSEYLEVEKKAYEDKKADAAKKAKERATTLGV